MSLYLVRNRGGMQGAWRDGSRLANHLFESFFSRPGSLTTPQDDCRKTLFEKYGTTDHPEYQRELYEKFKPTMTSTKELYSFMNKHIESELKPTIFKVRAIGDFSDKKECIFMRYPDLRIPHGDNYEVADLTEKTISQIVYLLQKPSSRDICGVYATYADMGKPLAEWYYNHYSTKSMEFAWSMLNDIEKLNFGEKTKELCDIVRKTQEDHGLRHFKTQKAFNDLLSDVFSRGHFVGRYYDRYQCHDPEGLPRISTLSIY